MDTTSGGAIGVLTSGGDAPGMNAAVRAVARTALGRGIAVYAIREGYQGLIDGGDRIHRLVWNDLGGILQRGGTIIGTARSAAFQTRAGRLTAARRLLEHGIDRLVVIGGDGSLTGADIFRQEWPDLLAELVAGGQVERAVAERHPHLGIVGLVGSIDNDMCGSDMTIGADTALHRITEAMDALSSTAASHQRTFVIEVMGRHCGFLALAGAIAGGADYVLLPEQPPAEGWEDEMCALLRAGRAAGRRDSIVVVAEGARDRQGQPITSEAVRQTLEEQLSEEVRVTILGHVQRGGTPSAYDRWMSTLLGHAAVEELLSGTPADAPVLVGIQGNRVSREPLMDCVADTRRVPQLIKTGDYAAAVTLRGGTFGPLLSTFTALARAVPTVTHPPRPTRLAVLHAGAPAPGMNTSVRAAVRLGLDRGHTMLLVRNGFDGLVTGDLEVATWGRVDGWGSRGGAEIGTSRAAPDAAHFERIAGTIADHAIDGVLIIGGWTGYEAAERLQRAGVVYPQLGVPMLCLPAAIDNSLPACEWSIGADTALNTIVAVIDKLKQSAVAARRCFVVEVGGQGSSYLPLVSGLATGAERVYLREEGVQLADLQADLAAMLDDFAHGKRLSVVVRNERASEHYTSEFLAALFAAESHGRFEVGQVRLGYVPEGGDPSPTDRILATVLAARAIDVLSQEIAAGSARGLFLGVHGGQIEVSELDSLPGLASGHPRLASEPWWLGLRTVARAMAQPTRSAPSG
jgi:6-phosphofructokinase 1